MHMMLENSRESQQDADRSAQRYHLPQRDELVLVVGLLIGAKSF